MVAKFINLCKLFFYIQKSNLKTAFLNTGDALVNVLMMTINNLSFIFMWWVIFHNKGNINGWTFSEMALLFAVSNNAFATYALFARGIQNLPEYISNGNLDNYLLTPRSSLFIVSTSESTFANWGDYLTGFIMYFLSGYVGWKTFFLMLLTSFLAFVILYSVRLIVSCFAFLPSGVLLQSIHQRQFARWYREAEAFAVRVVKIVKFAVAAFQPFKRRFAINGVAVHHGFLDAVGGVADELDGALGDLLLADEDEGAGGGSFRLVSVFQKSCHGAGLFGRGGRFVTLDVKTDGVGRVAPREGAVGEGELDVLLVE